MMLTHFESMLLFALFVSVAFGCLTHKTAADRVKSTLVAFGLFVLASVAIGWLMYPFSR